MCVSRHLPWRLHLSEKFGMQGNRSKMLCWSRFFPCQVPLSYSHTRSRESHELTRVCLVCQRLDSLLKCFCNSHVSMAGKKSELSVIKWPRNQLLNVVVTLWQRLDNVGQRLCHNVGDRCRNKNWIVYLRYFWNNL